MKRILLIPLFLLLLTICAFGGVNNILLCNVDGTPPLHPLGWCNNPAMTRIGALSFATGENKTHLAAIDTVNGFAYFTTFDVPKKIIKIRLSDFTEVGTMTLDIGEQFLQTDAINIIDDFIYTGEQGGKTISKIRLSTLTRVSSFESSLTDSPTSGCIIGNTMLIGGSVNQVSKVNLSSFAEEGILNLWPPVAGKITHCFAFDGHIYFHPTEVFFPQLPTIAKIRASDFTVVGTLQFPDAATWPAYTSVVVNESTGYAYYGKLSDPGLIRRLNLSSFTFDGLLTLSATEGNLRAAVIDTVNNYAYFSSFTAAKVMQIDLESFTKKSTISLLGSEYGAYGAVIDIENQTIYFGTSRTPGSVVKVDICGD